MLFLRSLLSPFVRPSEASGEISKNQLTRVTVPICSDNPAFFRALAILPPTVNEFNILQKPPVGL